MKPRRLSIALVLLVAGGVFAGCEWSDAGPEGGAQRIYRDPETGEIGAPPAGVTVPVEDEDGGAAQEPLVVEPGKTSAGGVMVNLHGRRRYALEARLESDGSVVTECVERDE